MREQVMKLVWMSLCAVALCCLGLCGPARADVVFNYVGVPEPGSANPVNAGQALVYDIFLKESVTPGGTQELINTNGGLFGAGFFVITNTPGQTAITGVNLNTNPTTGFGTNSGAAQKAFTPTMARGEEQANGANGNVLVNTTDGGQTFTALLGTLNLLAGAPGSSTTFMV